MKSSRRHNLPAKFLLGLNYQSIGLALMGAVGGLLLIGFVTALDLGAFATLFAVLASVIAIVQLWRFSEADIAGEFKDHGKEQRRGKDKKKAFGSGQAFSFQSLPSAEVDELKALKKAFPSLPLGYDAESIYRIMTGKYSETFGFDLSAFDAQGTGEWQLFSGSYHVRIQSLLKDLPEGAGLQIIRHAVADDRPEIAQRRPALLAQRPKRLRFYAIIGLVSRQHSAEHKAKALQSMHGFRRLRRDELLTYQELISAPWHKPTTTGLPLTTATTDGDFIEPYYDDYLTGCTGLGRLPEEIDESFGEIYNIVSDLEHVVSVRYYRMPGLGVSELFARWRTEKKREAGKAEVAELEVLHDISTKEAAGDLADLRMDAYVLIHGPKAMVQDRILRLQADYRNDIPSSEQAKFVQLKGYAQDALEACYPGSMAEIETRLRTITSYREASCYACFPQDFDAPISSATMLLRNLDNTVASVDLAQSTTTLFTLIIGKPGRGKSALMSFAERVHEEKQRIEGINTMTVAVDVGGSLSWRTDDEPGSVLAFQLIKAAGGNWASMPVWPLAALMVDAGKSDGDLEAARNFICLLTDVDPERVNQAQDVTLITDAVRRLAASGKELRLSLLKGFLEARFREALNEFSQGAARDQWEMDWKNRLAYLDRFCAGGEFGRIFDPDQSQPFDVDQVRFWYFNIQSPNKTSRDLISGFLSFAYAVAFALGDRFNPLSEIVPQEKKRQIQLFLDEANWQAEFIRASSITDLPDQCRKFGIIPVVVYQNFEYLARLDEAMVKTVGRIFFFHPPEDDLKLADMLRQMVGSDAKVAQMKRIGAAVVEAKEKHIHSVGYVDERRRLKRLYVDLEPEFLWEITTREGGADLRRKLMQEGQLSRREAALLLARYGPAEIPTAKQSEDYYEKTIKRILGGQ